ncbi:hypothetical protein N8198_02810 [Gammaproteobacteria bacterium]|nr:hypothetical protein [Gammaproteobacteria bacterium]
MMLVLGYEQNYNRGINGRQKKSAQKVSSLFEVAPIRLRTVQRMLLERKLVTFNYSWQDQIANAGVLMQTGDNLQAVHQIQKVFDDLDSFAQSKYFQETTRWRLDYLQCLTDSLKKGNVLEGPICYLTAMCDYADIIISALEEDLATTENDSKAVRHPWFSRIRFWQK